MVTSPKPARRIPRRARRTAAVITASLLASGFSMANAIAETPQPGNDATEVPKQAIICRIKQRIIQVNQSRPLLMRLPGNRIIRLV